MGEAGGHAGPGTPSLAAVEDALEQLNRTVSEMRETGELRAVSMDDEMQIMAFDFALQQMRENLGELATRSKDLAGFAGSTTPWLRWLTPSSAASQRHRTAAPSESKT